MTRQFDVALEERQELKDKLLVSACEFELVGSLSSVGATLTGFSVKLDQYNCLITLRAIVDDLPSVAFVSADTLADAIRKCPPMARTDRLKWIQDVYVKQPG